jgi:hypothetical protein
MKSKELRIGNYVDLGNRIGKIHEIYSKSCVVVDLEETQDTIEDYERTKPIPLTEEWLINFGFKQLDKYTWLKNGWFVYNRKRGFVTGSKKREIKLSFVHKLQNWYYLTGEELTIK